MSKNRIVLACCVIIMTFSACAATRKQILAEVWLNNTPLDHVLCEPVGEILEIGLKTGMYKMVNGKPKFQYGFYRKLDNGKYEFLSFCEEAAGKMVSMDAEKFQGFLDALLPEKKK